MTDQPKLTVEVKNIYGRLCAYPKDTFTAILLDLKAPAKSFTAPDIPKLRLIAGEIGAELVVLHSLVGKDLARWTADQGGVKT